MRGVRRKQLFCIGMHFGKGCSGRPKDNVSNVAFEGVACAKMKRGPSLVRKLSGRQAIRGIAFRGMMVGKRQVGSLGKMMAGRFVGKVGVG